MSLINFQQKKRGGTGVGVEESNFCCLVNLNKYKSLSIRSFKQEGDKENRLKETTMAKSNKKKIRQKEREKKNKKKKKSYCLAKSNANKYAFCLQIVHLIC